jgi:hypothetical protein
MNTYLNLLLGLFVRIGLPIGVTALVIYLLGRLDRRWQKDVVMLPVVQPGQKSCWQVMGCDPRKKKDCPAFANASVPCWQIFRAKDGVLKTECLGCEMFRSAPVPVKS